MHGAQRPTCHGRHISNPGESGGGEGYAGRLLCGGTVFVVRGVGVEGDYGGV